MSRARSIRAGALLSALGIAAGCAHSGVGDGSGANVSPDAGGSLSGSADGSGGQSPLGGGSVTTDGGNGILAPQLQPSGTAMDFPAPILEGAVPPNSAMLFGPPAQGATSGGPCLVEPEGDALYPQNWLRPRFRWTAANGSNLFELRVHVANQVNDLVVYTASMSWTMPKSMWDVLRLHSASEAMVVSIRSGMLAGSVLQGEAMGSQTPMGVAPVQATGAIVYWTTNDAVTGGSVLKGFTPGDESVQTVLTPPQYAQAQQTTCQCIGCHTSTPDGEFAAFTATTTDQRQWPAGLALIDPTAGTVGTAPPFLQAAGAQALASRWNAGGITFSRAHWSTGDRRAIVSFDNNDSRSNIVLSWIDLEATTSAAASGTLARTGDTQLAGAPTWSHDGRTIAYVSTNRICTGRLGNCTPQWDAPPDLGSRADIYTVPYAGGLGGNATGLGGASDPTLQDYYPAFSPDDRWLAFNRINNDLNLYDQPAAELYAIPSSGGVATRLAANDPPLCSGLASPGLANEWPKWGPSGFQANGNTYYWVIFSSKRLDMKTPQLYMTSIVQRSDGSLGTHGAVYLWNQPRTERNHTPAWDAFKVQPPPQ